MRIDGVSEISMVALQLPCLPFWPQSLFCLQLSKAGVVIMGKPVTTLGFSLTDLRRDRLLFLVLHGVIGSASSTQRYLLSCMSTAGSRAN